tara:strand:- start:5229 stop:6104 length:876 start_codon:yes stop_codon:yes gene_type:complete
MKKILLILCLVVPGLIFAADTKQIGEQYFSSDIPSLDSQEKSALAIAKKWQKGGATSKPFRTSDGSVSFVFGSGQTRIVCAVLQVCDVALQVGEQFNNMNVGDPRFTVEPSITGNALNQQIHLLIKPTDVGLNSSLVVTTDRRTYHFSLKSTHHDFMPYVSFIYPDDAKAKWRQIQQMQQERKGANTFSETHEYLGNLNFNYRLSGDARWKPVRVYNDGKKTIIEMPKAMNQTEAPALLVLRGGSLFKSAEKVMVNYRVQNRRYIVDSVFDQAILVAGSGSSQQQISITRC